jgi:putative membrane protein
VREPGVEDATRRTRLANERTYLAWWRTGLTALALAVGVGRVVPDVSDATAWPWELAGVGFGILGLAFLVFGYVRARAVEQALDQGGFAPFSLRLAATLLLAGLLLGAATVLIIVADR